MRKGLKARPHDLEDIIKLKPELIEIHASSEDLKQKIDGNYDLPLVVHLPEYDGSDLIDPASLIEKDRFKAVEFYKKAIDVARDWGTHFKGDPKVIMHPGGMSSDPPNQLNKIHIYEAFYQSVQDINLMDIDFLVENMPPQPWFYGGQWYCSIFMNPTECRDYCTGNGWGFCLDVCHAYLYCNYIKSISIMDFIRKVRPIVAHVHISDGKGVDGEGIQIGDGTMPLKDIVEYLNPMQIGIVPEIWLGHRDNYAGFKIAWEKINAMIPIPA